MSYFNFVLLNSKQCVISIFIVFFCIQNYSCETCTKRNSCECAFTNGSVIDLTSIGDPNKPRFANLTARHADNYTYYYNPCFSFKLGSSGKGCADGVAVCQVDNKKNNYFDCGDADDVMFVMNEEDNKLHLIYSAKERNTNITLICSENAIEPKLVVEGENHTGLYLMTLTSRCACPDLCRKSHLSAGSVLVILFMIFVSLYLVLGIIHSSLTRGAHGWELIPNYEFWTDFPLLVRDGCVFVVNGCKPETAYERI